MRASLRSAAVYEAEVSTGRSPEELDRHAQVLYEWRDVTKVSRIRMLAQWQSAAGLSHFAATHHRAAHCLRYHGNSQHGDKTISTVSLEEFQKAVKSRHALGDAGIAPKDYTQSSSQDSDRGMPGGGWGAAPGSALW